MRVAILHYWFLLHGGGEKVVSSLLRLYPDADVFCLFASRHAVPAGLSQQRLHSSFLNRIPFAHRMNRMLFPLYLAAVGTFDFSGYDLILSSDSPPIKSIIVQPGSVHLSYCHTPPRFLWDLAPTFTAELPVVLRPLYAQLAAWARDADFAAAQRVDRFAANSRYIQGRIRKFYLRKSTVIYPPVDTKRGYLAGAPEDYYLSVGRLVATKRIDLLIEACNQLKRKLVIAGTGREEKRLKAMAGPTVEFLGRVSDEHIDKLYANCRAFLFAADEDFGIVPVEAQSYGRPVIAYGHGGSLETVRVNDPEGQPDTGVYFSQQSVDSVMDGIRRFEARETKFQPEEIQRHARQFDTAVFEERFRAFVNAALEGTAE